MKLENGPAWKRAVEIDHALRSGAIAQRRMKQEIFVHRSCLPLDQVNFVDPSGQADRIRGQGRFGFAQECEGMCGV